MNDIKRYLPNEIVGFRPTKLVARLLAKAKRHNPHRDWTHICNTALQSHLMPQYGGKVEEAMAQEKVKG